jgi:hypothetical protein
MATEERHISSGIGAGIVITDKKKARQMIREAQQRAAEAKAAFRENALKRWRERQAQQEQHS